MHNSLIVRFAILVLIMAAFAMGWLMFGILELLQPSSPLLACGITAAMVLSLVSAWNLLDN